MNELLRDFLIGLTSGAISSLIITIIWHFATKYKYQKAEDTRLEAQYIKSFSEDIQTIYRYLDRLYLELSFPESEEKNQNILRILNMPPSTPTLKYGLNAEGSKLIGEIYITRQEIEKLAKNNTLDHVQSVMYNSKLVKLQVELLKRQFEFRNAWSEYKKQKS